MIVTIDGADAKDLDDAVTCGEIRKWKLLTRCLYCRC